MMFSRIVILVASLVLAKPSPAQDFCSYEWTDALVSDKEFTAALRAFLGNEKLHIAGRSQGIYDVALRNMSGPPDDLERFPPNFVLASACSEYDCGDKAAVAIACPNTIYAVGIFHRPQATLTIFSRDPASTVQDVFASWQKKISAAEKKNLKLDWHTIEPRK